LLIVFLLAWLNAPPALASHGPISVSDDTGARITLARPAQRIISLSPNLTELLYSAGAGSRLVGTVQWSNFPKAALHVPRVGNTYNLDLEKIVQLRPNLVVAWRSGNNPQALEELRRLGFPVYVSEPRSLAAIGTTIVRLGILSGTRATADRVAAAYAQRLHALKTRYSHRWKVSVFYQIWNRPMFTVNRKHVISDVIDLCGGRNVFAGLDTLSPRIGVEAVLAEDPQVIVASGIDAGRPAWLDDWHQWPSLNAVHHGLLFSIPPDFIQRDTVRILRGAAMMCRDLDKARVRLRGAGNHSG
jgi:iron complex transport system substrate-binding protein